jgi:hypothetical protein
MTRPWQASSPSFDRENKPIVLDDVDGLYTDRAGIRLLKALGQTERTKTLSWQSDAPTLERRGIPRQFTTTSRVALVGNAWKTLNADVAALEDRGHLLLFEPSTMEVHRQAARWFWDQEIFDFVANHLHLMAQHSLRAYCFTSSLASVVMIVHVSTGLLRRGLDESHWC